MEWGQHNKEFVMKVKSLLESVFFLPCLLFFGCEFNVEPEHSREWTPQLEEFVQAISGKTYSTSWETDTEGTRQVTLEIESERLALNNEDPFSSATEGLPYMLKIDGEMVDDGLIMLEVREAYRFGESVVVARFTDQVRHAPVFVDGIGHHLDSFRFGLGNDGQPTLLEVVLQEGEPGASGRVYVRLIEFVN